MYAIILAASLPAFAAIELDARAQSPSLERITARVTEPAQLAALGRLGLTIETASVALTRPPGDVTRGATLERVRWAPSNLRLQNSKLLLIGEIFGGGREISLLSLDYHGFAPAVNALDTRAPALRPIELTPAGGASLPTAGTDLSRRAPRDR